MTRPRRLPRFDGVITGHNTDVEYAGRVYHIQTEDKGRRNPLIETLIYSKGEILDTRRSSYSDIAEEGYSETEVIRRMDEQHRRSVRDVGNGRYDPEGPKPFGYNIITSRSFDEVVRDTLSGLSGGLVLEILGEVCFFEAASVAVELSASLEAGGTKPAAGALVRMKLVRTSGKPVKLFEGKTDPEGRLRASVDVPGLGGAEGVILIQADSGGAVAEVRRPVLRPGAPR